MKRTDLETFICLQDDTIPICITVAPKNTSMLAQSFTSVP